MTLQVTETGWASVRVYLKKCNRSLINEKRKAKGEEKDGREKNTSRIFPFIAQQVEKMKTLPVARVDCLLIIPIVKDGWKDGMCRYENMEGEGEGEGEMVKY